MTCTRLDLCFALTRLSQFLARPRNQHLNICKISLRYLRGTSNLGLTFVKTKGQVENEFFMIPIGKWGGGGNAPVVTGKVSVVIVIGCLMRVPSCRGVLGDTKLLLCLLARPSTWLCPIPFRRENSSDNCFLIFMARCQVQINLFADNQEAIDLAKNPVVTNDQSTLILDIISSDLMLMIGTSF